MLKKILGILLCFPFVAFGALQNIPFDNPQGVSGYLQLDPDLVPTSVSSTFYGTGYSRMYNNSALPIKSQSFWLCYKGKVAALSLSNGSPCYSWFAQQNWIPSGGYIEFNTISGYFANDTGNRCAGLPTNAPYIPLIVFATKNTTISLTSTYPYCYVVASATGATQVWGTSTLISKNFAPAFASISQSYKGAYSDLTNLISNNIAGIFGGLFLFPVIFFSVRFFKKHFKK